MARVDIVKALTTPRNLTHPRTRALSHPSHPHTHTRTFAPPRPPHPSPTPALQAPQALRLTLYIHTQAPQALRLTFCGFGLRVASCATMEAEAYHLKETGVSLVRVGVRVRVRRPRPTT